MNIFFRVDASIKMGSGHLMRCLTLAEQLKKNGAEVSFISRNHKGNLFDLIKEKGYKLYQLEGVKSDNIKSRTKHSHWLGVDWVVDAKDTMKILHDNGEINWLIIDHYAIDEAWEKQVRPFVKNIMVIDDLADRKHDCDILLDQNYFKKLEIRYENLVSKDCIKLLGPKYVLLRNEFRQARKKLSRTYEKINRIMVFFGGTDLTNETQKTLDAIRDLSLSEITFDIIVGEANPHKETIRAICNSMVNVSFHCQINNIAELMTKADLAIGAGGTTTWERCCLGLPSLIISVATNQDQVSQQVGQEGIALYLGKSEDVNSYIIKDNINRIVKNSDVLKDLSTKSSELVDGKGIYRVVEYILSG